jgi:hypothetical protein
VQDVTGHVARFREAARHLWNTAFHPAVSWDDRDRFDVVIAALFDALVLAPAAIVGASLPPMADRDPPSIPALRVEALGAELPIMIKRVALLASRPGRSRS